MVDTTEAKRLLASDLCGQYEGIREARISYINKHGKERLWNPSRFRMAIDRADRDDSHVEVVERLMLSDEPSRGFGFLVRAGRLDLTVEALVADESKPYHGLFSAVAVKVARDMLAKHGGPARIINVRVSLFADGRVEGVIVRSHVMNRCTETSVPTGALVSVGGSSCGISIEA